MAYVRVALFFGLTAGHMLVVGVWLARRWPTDQASPEERFFHAMVLGLGSLQAVLHGLACTVGIGLWTGLAGLALLDLGLLVSAGRVRRTVPLDTPVLSTVEGPAQRKARPSMRTGGTHTEPKELRSPTRDIASLTCMSLPGIVGIAIVGALVCSWLVRAPQSLQIIGVDSRYYHAPYAAHYAHGLNIFGFVATPHYYPVGASILGAWFYQPFADPVLLDLINLPVFLLLYAALVYLFRLLTDESGFEWATVVFLLLFTGKLFRASLFIAADLLYAAGFVAVFAQLCAIWVRNRIERLDWLTLAAATGLLLSSKIQGMMSAALMFAFWGAAVAVGALRPGGARLHVSWAPATLVASAVLMLASGGIWLIRNWLVFGSPLAPAGLRVFGVTIFPGSSPYSDWLSIAKDMRDTPGYNLPARFLTRARTWVGTWPAYLTVGVAFLTLDVARQGIARRRLSATLRGKLFALGFFVALFVVHARILIQTQGTSIEILGGQTVRYIIPFFTLFPMLLYACCFSDTDRWTPRLRLQWVVLLPVLLVVLAQYNAITQMPPEWVRAYGPENLLDYWSLPLALAVLAPWYVRLPPLAARVARGVSAALLVGTFGVFVRTTVTTHAAVMSRATAQFAQQVRGFVAGRPAQRHRGVLLQAVADQRRRGVACPRTRFFVLSRFDFPLDLQDPAFTNVVIDLQVGPGPFARSLATDGPGRTLCDYVVAAYEKFSDDVSPLSADEVRDRLGLRGALQVVGDSAGFRVYRADAP